MHILKTAISSLLALFLILEANVAHAERVGFSGVVIPNLQRTVRVIEQPGTLVSFSDEIALAFPVDFGIDGKIRVFNDLGDLVKGLKLLSVASADGVTTRVAVVDLLLGTRQTFLLCDGNRCIRYNVLRN
ncbi:MAG: hypothetical protein AAGA76_09400 [Pseudomonadota bacterium]